MEKKGLEFSFGWIFALVVGAAILFLAIYAAVRLVTTERTVQDTEAAKQLEVILTPVETGTETAKSVTPITFPSEARVYNNCSRKGNFGEQKISVATSSGVGGKWQEPGFAVTSFNKYIFSGDMIQGKQVYAFSKPFSMPFKVANIVYLWTDKYCFENPPTEMYNEIVSLGMRNVNATPYLSNCDKNSIKVCFTSDVPECNITVNIQMNSVTKKGKTMFYQGDALLYGAIFSGPEVYECQVNRLMKRTSELAMLYSKKSEGIAARAEGCSSSLQGGLVNLAEVSAEINNSMEIMDIFFITKSLESANSKITTCKLWSE